MEKRFDEIVTQSAHYKRFPRKAESSTDNSCSELISDYQEELNNAPNLLRNCLERFLIGNVI